MSETITAICPECTSRYRLKPDMIGKRMRCTNSDCRAAFEIIAESERGLIGAVRLPDEDLSANAYGIREGEEILEPEEEIDWQSAPPPVQVIIDEPVPTEKTGGDWEDAVGARAPSKPKPAPKAFHFEPPPKKTNFGAIAIVGLSLIVIGLGIAGGIVLIQRAAQAEDRLAAEAAQYYDAGQFGKATDAYSELAKRYPSAVRAAEYRFMAALSGIRHRASIVPPEPEPALAALRQFMDDHGTAAFLEKRRIDVFEASLKILNDLVDEGMERVNRKPPDLDGADARLSLARKALALLARNAPNLLETTAPKNKVDALEAAIGLIRARDAARKEILKLLAAPVPDLDTAWDLIHRARFEDDAEIIAALRKAEETLRKLVVYKRLDVAAKPNGPAHPPVDFPDARPAATPGSRVPALARGVLWALEAKTGRVAWVDRLGIDAIWPPLRIAPGDGRPDEWLVIATEPPSISLRDSATGATRWYQPLEALPVGPAVIVGRRGFVALGGPRGKLLDIELPSGTIHGAFETGQPFAAGIAHRPGTNLLYVPAASQQVYVLDVAPADGQPRCVTTLNTGHSAGTLRNPPAIVGDAKFTNLMLAMAEGLGDTALTLYRLDSNSTGAPVAMTARLPGWTWFTPLHDVDRIAAVTDRGALGLYAFGRENSVDPPLYPLEDREAAHPLSDGSPQRALVVQADEGGLVVLANGRLSQWRTGIDRVKGRRLLPGWSLDQPLGSPLHEPAAAGPGIVTLTTLRADTAGAMTTAVDIVTGDIVWQRPLGFAPGDQLLQVGNMVAAIDDRGGIMLYDPASRGADGRLPSKAIAPQVQALSAKPFVVRAADSADWIVLPISNGVLLRNIAEGGTIVEKKLTLPAALAGTPAISDRTVVLPLANGSLVRASLDDGAIIPGPSWRMPGAASDAWGFVVPTAENKFVVADGARRLMKLSWPSTQDFELDSAGSLEMPAPIVRIVRDQKGTTVAVADADGAIIVVDVEAFSVLGRCGAAGQTITAGPVFSNNEVLYVIDGRTLEVASASNPNRNWQFTTPGDGLTGMSLLIEGSRRVLSDRSGQLFVIAVADGKVTHYTHSIAPGSPVGKPLAFGNDGLLIPLVDGTVAIVPRKDLQKKN